ncbi:MAG: hypothetical protein AAF603_01925 [Pseudomonadota bacterium]
MFSIKTLAAILTLGVLTACATTSATGPAATARFDDFQVVMTSDFTGYQSVYLAPITVSEEIRERIGFRRLNIADRTRPLSESDINRKSEDLAEDLRRAISAKANLVNAPGPSILTIEVMLTELQANRPTLEEINDNVGLSLQSRYEGGAGASLTFKENGAVLATARDTQIRNLDPLNFPEAIWRDADQFFVNLANKTADLLGS